MTDTTTTDTSTTDTVHDVVIIGSGPAGPDRRDLHAPAPTSRR